MLRLILVLMTVELVNIHLACKKNPSDYQQYLKWVYKFTFWKQEILHIPFWSVIQIM